jgi:hypothetical protein
MRTVSLLSVLFFGALVLNAGTIGPTCGSCYGATYSLDGSMSSSDTLAKTEDWSITYTINTTGYTGSPTDYISSVALKVTSSLISASLLSVTNLTTSANLETFWNIAPINTNQSNNGCSGSGNGWLCTNVLSGKQNVFANGNTYAWVFDVKMAANSLLSLASIQANYDPPTGRLVSEKVTVPEGSELPTLVVGVGLALWFFRRTRATA